MNKSQKKKLFDRYAVKKEVFTLPDGEQLAMTELSAKARAGYGDAFKRGEATDFVILHGFDDYSLDDADDVIGVQSLSDSVKTPMMMAVLILSGLVGDDEVKAEVEKKP